MSECSYLSVPTENPISGLIPVQKSTKTICLRFTELPPFKNAFENYWKTFQIKALKNFTTSSFDTFLYSARLNTAVEIALASERTFSFKFKSLY